MGGEPGAGAKAKVQMIFNPRIVECPAVKMSGGNITHDMYLSVYLSS